MSGGRRKPELTDLEKLQQATADARAATREAREAYKDLRGCMKDFEDLITHRSEEIYAAELRNQMEALLRILTSAVDQQKHAVIDRFMDGIKELQDLLVIINETMGEQIAERLEKAATTHLVKRANEVRSSIGIGHFTIGKERRR